MLDFGKSRDPTFLITGHIPDYIPNTDFEMVLPSDHPVHKFVSKGRPRNTSLNGELFMPHLSMKPKELLTEPDLIPVPPEKCFHCGNTSLIWDEDEELYKCLLCGRTM